MPSQRLTVALLVLLLVLMVLSGIWLANRVLRSQESPATTATTVATPLTAATRTATPLRPPPGYRLAGVAVGDPDSFAVVESPNGTHALYRAGAEVPGLGRILHIEGERIDVQGQNGQFELWVAPAPTATATPIRTPAARAPVVRTAAVRQPTPMPRRGSARGDTTPGSSPSAVPGRPVS